MPYARVVPLAIFLVVCISIICAPPSEAQATPAAAPKINTISPAGRIGPIDETSLVTLKGNRHPLAVPANDRGAVAPDLPMQRMLLVLQRDPANETALQELIAEQQNKSSPNFHGWLSPTQFGERFGAAKSDLQKLTGWLASHGFQVNRIAQSGMVIEFSGNARQVQEAFHTPIHQYVVKGKTYYANAADPQIPAALAPLVTGVNTLHNFEKQTPIRLLGSASRIANTSTWQPNFTFNGAAGAAHYLAPGDFAKIYNTASLYTSGIDGSGQSIAIVARTNINLSDMEIFRLAFGLPTNNPQIILDGPDPGNLFGLEEAEADLDTEWSGAIAPKAAIKLVVSASTNTTDGVDLSAQYIVDNNIAPILSTSFGQCEVTLGQAENAFFNNLWEQAAAQGITVVVSSGDSGPEGCQNFTGGVATPAVNGLASTPFNIAVGGTEFNENGADSTYWSATNGPDQSSVLGYIPEQVWNESCFDITQCFFLGPSASGGGPSGLYSKPAWQAGLGVPIDNQRDLPDVSLASGALHDGLLLCQDGICLTDANGQLINAEVVGGTSAATPAFAGIMALVDQKTNSRQGLANFVLYPLAATETAANCNASASPQATCIFSDITQGNTNVPGLAGYPATQGYDLATGLGSINAANLITNWANITFSGTKTTLSLAPTATTHGQPITASVTVVPLTTGAGTPTGGGVALLTGGSQNQNLGVLTKGALSSPISTLPGGSYTVSASYGGDAKFGSSTSSPGVPVTIAPESSTLTFTTSSTTTTYSSFFFSLQASVAGVSNQGIATGNVTFSDNFNGSATTLATAPLNSQGNMSLSETSLGVGSHTLNASYAGDSSFKPSSAGPVTVTVNKGPTQTILFLPTGALPNTTVFLQALVFPTEGVAFPTGTVQFFDGANPVGNPVPVKNEVATTATMTLPGGANTITATYSGDANFNASTAPAATLYVGNPDFQLSVNPGNVTVSSTAAGTSTIFVTPGPGIGFAGPVSLSCSTLPASTSCAFQPAQLNLDGFTTMNTKLTITKGAHATFWGPPHMQQKMIWGSVNCLVVLSFAFLGWSMKRRRWSMSLCTLVLLVGLFGMSGCGGGSGAVTPPGSTTQTITPSLVTVTATGNSGISIVTHNVTLAVTVQ